MILLKSVQVPVNVCTNLELAIWRSVIICSQFEQLLRIQEETCKLSYFTSERKKQIPVIESTSVAQKICSFIQNKPSQFCRTVFSNRYTQRSCRTTLDLGPD